MKFVLLLSLSLISSIVSANEIFVLKKSFNPKNVLHFKANVEGCKLKTPAVANYWVMGEQRSQIEGLTNSEKPYFQPQITYQSDWEADFGMGAINKMGNRIEDKSIKVRLVNCQAKAFIEINKQEIQLTEIFASVGLLMNVKSMTIKGIAADGRPVSVKIDN
jgi:hypothetical protein